MLKFKSYFFVFFLFIPVISLYSQDLSYKVLASSGEAFAQREPFGWHKAKVGEILIDNDKIKINENGYMALVNEKGFTLELNTPGVYSLSDLAARIGKKKSVVEKFSEFVISKITTRKTKSENMKTLGAVVRTGPDVLDTYFPKSTYVLSGPVLYAWYPLESGKKVLFQVADKNDKTIFSKETEDTSIVISPASLKLKSGVEYKWSITQADSHSKASDPCVFNVYDNNESRKIVKFIDGLKKDLGAESPLNYFILGSYLEDKELFVDAMNQYEQVLKLAPDVEDYTNFYVTFLLKHDLTRRAAQLMKE